MRVTQETHASKLWAQELQAVAKVLKVPPPSRAMWPPILKQIDELLKRIKEIAMGTTGKKGRVILNKLMDEHIKRFPLHQNSPRWRSSSHGD
jgi:hypothetical protein